MMRKNQDLQILKNIEKYQKSVYSKILTYSN